MNSEMNAPSSGIDDGLKAAMEDFLMAFDKKSPIDMASAFKAAFDICESSPHEENEEGEA